MFAMKQLLFLFCLLGVGACNQSSDETRDLRAEIEKLHAEIQDSYKPGLGEFMNTIQLHHAKLWFAGINKNWPLADFELHEISETLDDIRKYNSDRPEIKLIGMLEPPLNTLNGDIEQRDQAKFRTDYQTLTQTCNQCHQNTDHGFNVITEPTSPPVTDQRFQAL